jgi:hypothetical protein
LARFRETIFEIISEMLAVVYWAVAKTCKIIIDCSVHIHRWCWLRTWAFTGRIGDDCMKKRASASFLGTIYEIYLWMMAEGNSKFL